MSERAELIKQFREFRAEHELETVTRYIPRHFDSIADLDERYHENEAKAEEQETRAQAQLAMHRETEPEPDPDPYVTRSWCTEREQRIFAEMGKLFRDAIAPLQKRIDAFEEASPYISNDGSIFFPVTDEKSGKIIGKQVVALSSQRKKIGEK